MGFTFEIQLYCSFLRAVSEWLKFAVVNVINNIQVFFRLGYVAVEFGGKVG